MMLTSLVQGTCRGCLHSRTVSNLCTLQSSKQYLGHHGKRIVTTQFGQFCIEQRTTKGQRYLATTSKLMLYSHGSKFEELSQDYIYRHEVTRKYSTAETEQGEIPELDISTTQPEFTPIYRFPYIVHARMISRFKVYHTIFTFALVPVGVYLYGAGVIPVTAVYTFTGVFTIAGIMLVVVSSLIRKIVGALYIDRKKESVKLSHLTFWSQRKDEYYKVSEIVPLSDTNEQLSDLFVKLSTFKGDSYYLTMKHGRVLEKEDFMEVVGSYSLK